MKKISTFFGFFSCTLGLLFAQNIQLANDIPVVVNGDTLYSAWSGAMNAPQFGQTDLNGDGKADFVLFDRVDRTFTPYLNVSTEVGQKNYRYAPQYKPLFDSCHCAGWAEFVDYDCDGDNDIFCGTPTSNVIVYDHEEILGDSFIYVPRYAAGVNSAYTSFTGALYSALIDYPGIYDVDQDGDMDFLTFGNASNYIELHKNLAMDSFQRCDTLVLKLDTYCWGHFYEGAFDCSAHMHDTLNCPLNGFHPNLRKDSLPEPTRDAGSTILALDLNQNNLTDLLIGDISCTYVYAVINNAGIATYAYIDSVQNHYPQSNVPIDEFIFPANFYWDVDGDSIKDLIYAPNARDIAENYSAVGLYKNLGQNDYPNFNFLGRGFIQDNTMEFGTAATPTYFDYNQDGKLDLLVGNYGYFSPIDVQFHSKLALFENIGTDSLVVFRLDTNNYLPYIPANDSLMKRIVPAVGDLDADGDEDLLLGSALGNIYYFRNDAPAGGNANFQFVTSTFANITGAWLDNSAPTLYDIDNDNDLDLFIGDASGYFAYYKNNGSPQVATFDSVTTRWGNIKVNNTTGGNFSSGNSKPILYDYDQDGDIDLLTGTIYGNIRIYTDISTVLSDTFTYVGHLFDFDFGSFSAPTAAVIDTSGKPVFIVGNQRGGLQLFKVPYYVAPDTTVGTTSAIINGLEWAIFPNPADEEVTVRFSQNISSTHISLYNMLGQELFRITTTEQESVIPLITLAPGMYYVRIENERQRDMKKLIVK